MQTSESPDTRPAPGAQKPLFFLAPKETHTQWVCTSTRALLPTLSTSYVGAYRFI